MMTFRLLLLTLAGIFGGLAVAQVSVPGLESLTRSGRWSKRFTIAGLTGEDGFAPVVYDFARDPQGRILAAGRFRWAGAQPVDPVVRLDGNNWHSAASGWDRKPPLIGFSAMAVDASGRTALSTNSGPFGRAPVEIWLNTGEGMQVIGRLRGSVRSMAWFKEKLWVAGYFQFAEGSLTQLAVWDGTAWSAPPGGSPDGAVYRLTPGADSLLLAGDFTTVGGIEAVGVAEWNGSTWRAYSILPPVRFQHVYAAARDGQGELYAGGALSGGMIRWNGSAWEPLGGGLFDGDFVGVVSDFTTLRGDLYATGCFSHVNGPRSDPAASPAVSVARWNGSRWESLDEGREPVASGWYEPSVCGSEPGPYAVWDMRHQRIVSDGERILLGGMMPGVAGVPSQSVVSYDGREWKAFGRTRHGLSGASEAVAVGPDGQAYIMGNISHAGRAPRRSGIFRYDKGWQSVGGPLPQGLSCERLAIDRSGSVFVGCNTRQTSPVDPPKAVVLRLEGENWSPVDLKVSGLVWDLRADPSGRIWAAGGERTGDSTGSGFLARLDEGGFTVVEDQFNSLVFRVAFAPGGPPEPIVGGAFTHIGGRGFGRIARWREGGWQPLGTGLRTGVMAVAATEDAIYASTEPPLDAGGTQILLGRWDGSQWVEVGTPGNGLPAPRERTVHTISDLLAVGRSVIAVGSIWPETGGRNVYVYDGARFSALGGGLNAISVRSVARARDGLWFTGAIAEAGPEGNLVATIGVARFSLPDANE